MKIKFSTIVDQYLGILLILCGLSGFIWIGAPVLVGIAHYVSESDTSESILDIIIHILWPTGFLLIAWLLVWWIPGLYFASSKMKALCKNNKSAAIALWIFGAVYMSFFFIALHF